MSSLSISLITVAYNAADTIENCVSSVIWQAYPNLEYIVIDGGSTDGTIDIINRYKKYITHFISEPDKGMYDALNKGIKLASGDIIGILNADDCFNANDILEQIIKVFLTPGYDIIYGDIDYINKQNKIIRKWRSGQYKHGLFKWGWMPPHPSFYARRELFEKLGPYRLEYGSAADYELMLRYIHANKRTVYYLDIVMVRMLAGGISNKNTGNRIKAWRNDYRAMKSNGIPFPYVSVIFKPLRKIVQFIK